MWSAKGNDMGEFLSYSIISGLLMLAMYLAYRLFLARDKQHVFNRSILMLVYLVSFLTIPARSCFETLRDQTPVVFAAEDIEIVNAAVTPLRNQMWGTVVIWIFLAGMAVVSARSVITWLRLVKVISTGEKIRRDGYTLVVSDNERFSPFSWMRYVVISRRDYQTDYSAIATHELKHVTSHHWIDLLIAQVVCIVNWFNPAAWLMRDELMLVHEYQADMAVIDSGHNPQEYQLLLIKKAVGARFPSLANSLNHSKLKKRITMMQKEKSGAGRKLRALALVPMSLLALGVAGVPAVRAAVSAISNSSVTMSEVSEKPSDGKVSVKTFKVTNINHDGNETSVVIKADGLGDHLTVSGGKFITSGKSYDAKSLKCTMTNGTATITATFPFSDECKNASMSLLVNGEDVPFDLENFRNKAQTVTIGDNAAASSKQSSSIVINSNSS